MKSVKLVQIFPVKGTNRTHSNGYVEDLSIQRGRKRYAKMAVLNYQCFPKEKGCFTAHMEAYGSETAPQQSEKRIT